MIDDSDMAVHLAAALLSLTDGAHAMLSEKAKEMARTQIRVADEQGVPLEIALALYGSIGGEIWVEIKRREMGRKS
jgi:hypothetical protein